jgi:vitamin B12 transporter
VNDGIHITFNMCCIIFIYFFGIQLLMKISIYILLILLPAATFGQIDSVQTLQQIIVSTQKIEALQIGKIITEIDSTKLVTQQFGCIKQHLAANANVFIKNYGTNNLSTISVRGSSASQVATIWNGFNLNMLSQSQIDMNLIPSFLIDKITIEYGASASKNGSGAIGSTIDLQSNLPMQAGHIINVSQQFGSFHNFSSAGKYFFSNAKFASSTKILYTDSKNDFTFFPNGTALLGKEKMQNNKFNQIGILQENKLIISKNHSVSAGFWWQNTNRQLPPSITSANTLETQADKHSRFYLHFNSVFGKYLHKAKVMASTEYLHYINPTLQIDNDYITNRVMLESEHVYVSKIGIFSAITQYNYGQMLSEKYISNAVQNRVSMQVSFAKTMFKNKLQTAITGRQDWVSNQTIPITFSANGSYQILNYLKINSVINSMFRLPTFNDLFWAGTGNPNLKSEQGIGADVGILFHSNNQIKENGNNKNLQNTIQNNFEIGITSFTRNVNNWIIWTPNTSNIWRPQNVLQVWSRGLELVAHYDIKINKFYIAANANYAFTKSTNQKVTIAMINALHQQLIYTPIHTWNANLNIRHQNWHAIYQLQSIGVRFTTSDNENKLPNYQIGNVQIRKTLVSSNYQCTIGAGINNIANLNYQTIAFRAMPLRNYFVSLQMQLNSNLLKN